MCTSNLAQETFSYIFSIQLKGYSSTRLFQVFDETALSQIHDVIQDAFELDHLYAYRFYRNKISPSHNWKGFPILPDASSAKNALSKHSLLSSLRLKEGDIITYIYHPEYNWLFYITILSREAIDISQNKPIFLSYKETSPLSKYTFSQNKLLNQLKGIQYQ